MRHLFVTLYLFSAAVLAQEVRVTVVERQPHPRFSVGVGSRLTLELPDDPGPRDAVFLGRMVDQDRQAVEYLFLDEKRTRILMIDPENVRGLRASATQAVISPIDQVGSTCAAYGVFHFWDQTHASKLPALPALGETMASDRRRMQLFEELLDTYYIQNKTNLTTLMGRLGNRFGFRCRSFPFSDGKRAADFLFERARSGSPILVDFNIGGDMVASTYEVTDFETPVGRDPRIWVPRRVGQRTSSGHVIVAAAAFVANGRRKLLVLDSNWTEPRVWDLERYVVRRVAVREMGFHSCEAVQ
jgi:hypothetical protein